MSERILNDIPNPDRRVFLQTLGGIVATVVLTPLIAACSPAPDRREIKLIPTPRPDSPSRDALTEEGREWTFEEIEQLAESMRSDSQFRKIAQAGEILYQNQQGNPSISAESSLFGDRRIRFFTVRSIEHPTINNVPIETSISQEQPEVITTLRSRDGRDRLSVHAGTSLGLDRIRISETVMEGKSDFLFRLFVAKEIYNIHAFDLAIRGIFDTAYANYEIPDAELLKRALQVRLIHWEIPPDGIPLSTLADIWAHHIILPDYERAKDLGMFSEDELRSSSSLEWPSEHFKQVGLLYKDSDGEYHWNTNDMSFFYDQWYKTAFASWKILF